MRTLLVAGLLVGITACEGGDGTGPSPSQYVGTYALLSFDSHPLPTTYRALYSENDGLLLLADTLVLGLTSHSWGSALHRMVFQDAGGVHITKDRLGGVFPQPGTDVILDFSRTCTTSYCLELPQPEQEMWGVLVGDQLSFGTLGQPPYYRVYRRLPSPRSNQRLLLTGVCEAAAALYLCFRDARLPPHASVTGFEIDGGINRPVAHLTTVSSLKSDLSPGAHTISVDFDMQTPGGKAEASIRTLTIQVFTP